MDAELQELLRRLPPDVRAWIERLLAGSLTMSASQLRVLITTLLAAGADTHLTMRVLMILARMGILDAEIVLAAAAEADVIIVEAATAAEATGATEAGAGGVALTGSALAAILLIIAAIIMWGIAIWELNSGPPTISTGPACGDVTTHRITRVIQNRSWGCRRSLRHATEAANSVCATLTPQCTGGCAGGKLCKSVASIQSVTQNTGFLWCTTTITYKCPCTCV